MLEQQGGSWYEFFSLLWQSTDSARTHPDGDVNVYRTRCAQANIPALLLLNAEMLITSDQMSLFPLEMIYRNFDVNHQLLEKTPRATVAGYLDSATKLPLSAY